MPNSDEKNGLEAIDLLEEKVNELLENFRTLRFENQEYKKQMNDSNSSQVILDNSKRKQLRKKIENLLEYLEDF
jgi:regulator of replication initiation timing